MEQKIADYTRFGQVLLAIGAFLMIGLILPNGEKDATHFAVMIGAIFSFLGGSFYFFYRVKEMRNQLEESEHDRV
ncbi:YrhC family protein [Bacillus manliponensis]